MIDLNRMHGMPCIPPDWRKDYEALITELRAARRVVEAARKFHGNINESVFTQNCTVCQEIAAYDRAVAALRNNQSGEPR